MVTGARNFGNGGTYDFGNVVTATANPTRFMIPVGWADPIPTIVLSAPAPMQPSQPRDHGDLSRGEPQGVLGSVLHHRSDKAECATAEGCTRRRLLHWSCWYVVACLQGENA